MLVVDCLGLETFIRCMRFGFDVPVSDVSFKRLNDVSRDFAQNVTIEMASFPGGVQQAKNIIEPRESSRSILGTSKNIFA
jgi:hypothetical protein